MGTDEIEKYGILMSYLEYENSMFWGRANYFLLAQTALFGFTLTNLPALVKSTPLEKIIIPGVAGVVGLIIAYSWWKALKSGELWINRWHTLIISLEPKVFGELNVIRERDPKGERAKNTAYHMVIIFIFLWLLAIIYSVFGYVFMIF